MKKGLIQTVGLTDGPIVASLRAHKPDFVVFLASEKSLPYVEQALAKAPVPGHKALRIRNPEDMNEVFAAGRKAHRLLKAAGVEAFLADPTGGTKTMAAGLTLALAGFGFTFVYVGGNKRDEAGRVVSGHEEVRQLQDPTERFHVFEQRAFMQAWNGWRFRSALEFVARILSEPGELSEAETRYYEALRDITQGMYEWDRFHHAAAYQRLTTALPQALEVAETWRHPNKTRVLGALSSRLDALETLRKDTQSGHPTFAVLADLLANAERRAESGRFDDALARLYRAVELAVEAHFYERHGMHLKNPNTWPEVLDERPSLKKQAREARGLFSIVEVAFNVATGLGERGSFPQRLYAQKETLHRLVMERNKSILAHGVQPVEEKDYQALRDFLASFGFEAAPPWPRWGEA